MIDKLTNYFFGATQYISWHETRHSKLGLLEKKTSPYKPSSYKPQQNCTVLDEVLIAEICTPGNFDTLDGYSYFLVEFLMISICFNSDCLRFLSVSLIEIEYNIIFFLSIFLLRRSNKLQR